MNKSNEVINNLSRRLASMMNAPIFIEREIYNEICKYLTVITYEGSLDKHLAIIKPEIVKYHEELHKQERANDMRKRILNDESFIIEEKFDRDYEHVTRTTLIMLNVGKLK